jgi:hypothetical protein
MHAQGHVGPSGNLGLRVIRNGQVRETREAVPWPLRELKLPEIAHFGLPRKGLDERINEWRTANFRHLMRGARRVLLARTLKLPCFYGSLYLTHFRNGEPLELGLASMRVVTDTGVGSIVDAFMNTFELESYDFHGFGTGGTAEAASQTALVTEETTQYVVDNTRPTGTPSEQATNIYRSVATYSPDSGGTRAITEHGLFSQAATGGGVMLDRSLFAAVNLIAGSDSLQSTYDFTVTAGG